MSDPDFTTIIAQKAKGFVGREWVFDSVNTWLKGTSRIFLLVGSPGTGKSAIAARLAQMSDTPIGDAAHPEIRPGFLAYYHFCQAGKESTLSPITFVRSLSEALANRYESFGKAVANSGSTQIVVNVRQEAGSVQTGGQMIGAKFSIEIKGADPWLDFDLAVSIPAQALSAKERVVILIDSLDEALTFRSVHTITSFLRVVNDLPPQVRFICTSRTNIDQVTSVVGPPALDLIANAPPGTDDVMVYALGKLADLPEPGRTTLAENVTVKSKGNFLYAYYVLMDLVKRAKSGEDLESLELPVGLEDVYREYFNAKLASNLERWKKEYRPMLGPIAVAHGDGLTKAQLVGITRMSEDKANDVIEDCAEYLVGGGTESAPIHIYHDSFRDFVLNNRDLRVYPADRHADVATYMQKLCARFGKELGDEYALRYSPAHWADAAELSAIHRDARTRKLIELVRDEKYRRRFEGEISDLPMFHSYLERAVRVAALSKSDDMLDWLVKASKGLVDFRRGVLRSEAIVELAEEGLLEQAEARLRLFTDVEEDWLTAARLIVAWLGIIRNPTAARTLRDRIAQRLSSTEPLPLLLDRLSAVLDGHSPFDFERGELQPIELGRQIINRIKGQEFDQEMLLSANVSSTTMRDQQPGLTDQIGYFASLDGPILVNLARQHGEAGTSLLDEYISAHAGHNLVQYRNRSLWIMLEAILRYHPDPIWVKRRLKGIMIASLSGGGVDFEEMLPMTARAMLQTARKAQTARVWLEKWRHLAQKDAQALAHDRHPLDSWGIHRRRLTALMELYALVLRDHEAARILNVDIQALPGGFASYEVPTSLRLADAFLVCGMPNDEIARTLGSALKLAHKILDYHMCARMTARCNTIIRWHANDLKGADLMHKIRKLAANPHDVEFATDHMIGEAYEYRNPETETMRIDPARNAKTLRALSGVFQLPSVEFLRCNPKLELDRPIDIGTVIRVPDGGFLSLLAIHLAARVLVDASLALERSGLIRELVPIAASTATAVDTVLSYLLIAAESNDVKLLEKIVDQVGDVINARDAVPVDESVEERPDAGLSSQARGKGPHQRWRPAVKPLGNYPPEIPRTVFTWGRGEHYKVAPANPFNPFLSGEGRKEGCLPSSDHSLSLSPFWSTSYFHESGVKIDPRRKRRK